MLLTVSIMSFLIFQTCVIADDNSNTGTEVTLPSFCIIGIIIGSVLVTIIGTGLAYLTFRCSKRRLPESHGYGDDVSIEKDRSEYCDGNEKNGGFPIPHLYQIQPILTVSEVVSSIKQSLEDLGDVIIPRRWSTPKQIVNQETQVKEPNDFYI